MPVEDSAVVQRLQELLKGADLAQTTEKKLRKQLEEELGEDLSDKKKLIRAEVEKFLAEAEAGEDDNEGDGDDEDQEQERPAKARGSALGSLLSEELQAFLGVETMSRPQVVKAIWAYVKENNLQDPKDKRRFILDDKMKLIFVHPTTMFNMNKQLSKHCKTSDAAGGGGSARARASSSKPAAKRQKTTGGGGGGFTAPVKLSADLAAFVGAEEMSRPQLTKLFNAYFTENNLKDPSNRQFVLADAALLKLFPEEERFKAFGLQRLLKPHIIGKGTGASATPSKAASEGEEDAGEEEGQDEQGAAEAEEAEDAEEGDQPAGDGDGDMEAEAADGEAAAQANGESEAGAAANGDAAA